jgi:hypothetical protein
MDYGTQTLHLPNTWNCIQSALYQLEIGNPERARQFLESAAKSLAKATQEVPHASTR